MCSYISHAGAYADTNADVNADTYTDTNVDINADAIAIADANYLDAKKLLKI